MRHNKYKRDNQPRVMANERIAYDNLRVTMVDGSTELMTKQQALNTARQLELDLILVTDKADPPVCQITSLNKFIFKQKQREKDQKKKQRESKVNIKEIRMGLNIDDHDLQTKVNSARKFLQKNATVIVTITLKGRERGKQHMAHQLLAKFAEMAEARMESNNSQGNRISCKLKG